MQKNQIKSGDLVIFNFDSFNEKVGSKLFASYLTSAAFSKEKNLYEIKNGELGIIIFFNENISIKASVLFVNSKMVLNVDSRKLIHIGDISP